MRLAIGTRPAADLPVEFVDASTYDEVRPPGRRLRDRPAGARRRGDPGRRPRHRPPAQGRDRRPPAHLRRDRPRRRPLARRVRPGRRARWCTRSTRSTPGRPSPRCCASRVRGVPALTADRRPGGRRGRPDLAQPAHRAAARRGAVHADTAWAMGEIMAGEATPAQIAAFAVALRAKGETPAEIAGLVEAMLANAAPVELPDRACAARRRRRGRHRRRPRPHGQHLHHGRDRGGRRRAYGWSSTATGPRPRSCGAADLLEHLGIPLDLGPDEVARCVAEAGIGFCFAARFHPGMRHAGRARGARWACPTVVQLPRPADQPGPAARRRGRLLRRADGAGDGRGVRRAAATRCW